jgi:hypothetical protein
MGRNRILHVAKFTSTVRAAYHGAGSHPLKKTAEIPCRGLANMLKIFGPGKRMQSRHIFAALRARVLRSPIFFRLINMQNGQRVTMAPPPRL